MALSSHPSPLFRCFLDTFIQSSSNFTASFYWHDSGASSAIIGLDLVTFRLPLRWLWAAAQDHLGLMSVIADGRELAAVANSSLSLRSNLL